MSKNSYLAQAKNHQSWSWVLFCCFFILGFIDARLGLLGFLCMGIPIYHALLKRGKVHCAKYCPRGSFFSRFLKPLSIQLPLPAFLRSKIFKNIFLTWMVVMFSYVLIKTNLNIAQLGYAIYRMMAISAGLGVVIGIVFKSRSWCQMCPMGHATDLITQAYKKRCT